MPKPIVNNKIIYQNVYGLVSKHEGFLSQGVRQGDSPTFANLLLTADATIRGNLYVEGNTTLLNTNVIEFEDNIVVLNRLESGAGVTLNQSGLEIERGSLENYRMVFNDIDDSFRIGFISNLQAVATREDSPLQNGIMMWNNSTKRLDSRSTISIDISSSSTTNATSTTSGSFVMSGGLGVQKDIWSGGKMYLRGTSHTNHSIIWTDTSNSLNLSSVGDIYLTPVGDIYIPYNKEIILGTGSESIVAESGTKNITISGEGHIDFDLIAGKRIRIPNQIPITFSTQTEQIYTDSSNNMVIGSGQDIHFIPGPNKKVVIPLDIGLAFSNNNQQISANLNNDLSIVAGNNIILTPGPTLDVRIPTDNGIRFGSGGLQRIVADSSNDLFIKSAANIHLEPTDDVTIPSGKALTFGGSSKSIKSTGNDLYIKTDNATVYIKDSVVSVNSTVESDNGTTGSIWTSGGLGVSKTIYTKRGVIVDSDHSESLLVRKNNSGKNILHVDSSNNGKITIDSGNGTVSNPSLEITTSSSTDAKSLIHLTTTYDNKNGYMIGRGYSTLNSGRIITVNIPTYADYSNSGDKPKFSITTNDCTEELFSVETETGNIISKGSFGLSNTQDASNATTASFVISGGLGIVKTIITSGDYHSKTTSETAVDIKNSNNTSVFNVDTQFNSVNIDGSMIVHNTSGNLLELNDSFIVDPLTNNIRNSMINSFTNTETSTDLSNGAVVVSGGVAISKNLRVGDVSYFSTIDMTGTRITNVQNPTDPQDSATKAYVDLVKQGLHVKDSVHVATVTNGNLNISYNTGDIIDGYTLQLGDRILIKDQEFPNENGIYIVQDDGVPIRSIDFATGANASGFFVFVVNGDLNGGLGWICNSIDGMDLVGTDDILFTQFTALGKVETGDGLSKTFNRIDVNVDNTSLEIVSDQLRIKNTAVGTGMTGGSGTPLQTSTNQSHVTKLGTIDTGTWQASAVGVFYGGTGVTRFTEGNLLFGNGLGPVKTDARLYYDSTNARLGVGTNQPSKNLHVSSISNVSLLLNADSDGASSTSKPEIIFSYSGDTKSYIGLSRTANEYSNNIYAESLVISHDKLDSTSVIQLTTQRQARMTILGNGNIGMNTSNPSARLHIVGTLITTDVNSFRSTVDSTNVSNGGVVLSGGLGVRRGTSIGGRLRVYDNTPSTNVNTGAVIVQGGLSVQSNQNSVNVGNGGGLTVAGGASIGGDLYIGGSINGSGSSSSTYAYLTLTATDEAVNMSTGSLVTLGGITIQATTNASSVTDGGSILTEGGASIGADLYIGGNTNVYGIANFWGSDNILDFYDENVTKRYSINRNATTNNFSLDRYDVSGTFIESVFQVDSTSGTVLFTNLQPSSSSTSAAMIITGGLSIMSTDSASSITNGGGLTVDGGLAISKNVFIGGDTYIVSTTPSTNKDTGALVVTGGIGVSNNLNVDGSGIVNGVLTTNNTFNYNGGSTFDKIWNTTGSSLWHYFGQINDAASTSVCEIDFSNITNTDEYSGLKLNVHIQDTTCTASHNYYGDIAFTSGSKLDVYIYQDASTGFHLFTKTPSLTSVNVRILIKSGDRFNIIQEGDGAEPDGSSSVYQNTWSEIYNTAQESNLSYKFGDVTVEGLYMNVADNFPVIGYNNSNTTSSRDLGLAFQRYQAPNDSGTGELVTDQYVFYDSIPDQSSASSTQIKFSNLLNATDNYYTGWWIKVASGSNTNQVRKIISYNGAQRVATLDAAWTTQNPGNGDTVYFYNAQYVSFYYNDTKKSFEFIYNTRDPVSKAITSYDYVDLNVNHITFSDTTNSSNASTGSIWTLGGVGITNTTDAESSTSGGTLTTLGGVGIRKRLYVGDNIGIGSGGFTPDASLHIKQTKSTIQLENDNTVSSIDFVKTGSQTRFGIVSDSVNNQFSMTVSTNGSTAEVSSRIFTVNSSGSIGIHTTSGINSPLTLNGSSLISSNNNSSYIGIVGGSSNTNDSTNGGRVIVYGNSATGSIGNVVVASGTSGSVRVCTNNDIERLRIDQSGVVSVLSTTVTKSRTAGALVVSGGIGVVATENASSFSAGGALTVAGGASIAKDFFVGGNLFITGNLNASGSSTAPEITFTNAVNCTLTSYDNNKLLTVSQEAIFSFVVLLTPTVASANCQIEFTAPGRGNGFETRGEYIATCTGYTDDDEIVPLFNVISVGVKNENRGLIKFQSVSTGIHYFTLICRYTMN
jgi:hypothetical protein